MPAPIAQFGPRPPVILPACSRTLFGVDRPERTTSPWPVPHVPRHWTELSSLRTVSARVLRDGTPFAGAQVHLVHVARPTHLRYPIETKTTDERGVCAFSPISTYPVAVFAQVPAAGSKLVEIGESLSVDLELFATAVVEGEVRKHEKPLQALVTLFPLDGGIQRSRRSDASGRYRIVDVVPGAYTVAIGEEGHSGTPPRTDSWRSPELVVEPGETIRRDLTFPSGVTVSVAFGQDCRDPHAHVFLFEGEVSPGDALELAKLWRQRASSTWRSSSHFEMVDTRSAVSFTDVLPGTYTVCAVSETFGAPGAAAQPVVTHELVVARESVSIELHPASAGTANEGSSATRSNTEQGHVHCRCVPRQPDDGRFCLDLVTNADLDQGRPMPKRGLFCEQIFGTNTAWECGCGKYNASKNPRHLGMLCEKCGVEATSFTRYRAERFATIALPCLVQSPATNMPTDRVAVPPPYFRPLTHSESDLNVRLARLIVDNTRGAVDPSALDAAFGTHVVFGQNPLLLVSVPNETTTILEAFKHFIHVSGIQVEPDSKVVDLLRGRTLLWMSLSMFVRKPKMPTPSLKDAQELIRSTRRVGLGARKASDNPALLPLFGALEAFDLTLEVCDG
jgi:hypothetical protein